jgi:hypothetical protein
VLLNSFQAKTDEWAFLGRRKKEDINACVLYRHCHECVANFGTRLVLLDQGFVHLVALSLVGLALT